LHIGHSMQAELAPSRDGTGVARRVEGLRERQAESARQGEEFFRALLAEAFRS
jgi:hypothetical protein